MATRLNLQIGILQREASFATLVHIALLLVVSFLSGCNGRPTLKVVLAHKGNRTFFVESIGKMSENATAEVYSNEENKKIWACEFNVQKDRGFTLGQKPSFGRITFPPGDVEVNHSLFTGKIRIIMFYTYDHDFAPCLGVQYCSVDLGKNK